MRYAQIREMDISNGDGIGISLFVQGCHFHCKNCFNQETWDFKGGKEWTPEVEESFIRLADKPYIKRISILGGEPLANENLEGVYELICNIRKEYGDKKSIWLYTGFTWGEIMFPDREYEDVCDVHNAVITRFRQPLTTEQKRRRAVVCGCNFIVDGQYYEELRNPNLKFRGSSNQNIIDVRAWMRL